ncbi:MAG: endonuclease/exonuclease/phosphatase family protein [Pirellulales bacterium]|nr:endonuclease/exonuclease/phosphatase family protein [Pirellulales bacterium]
MPILIGPLFLMGYRPASGASMNEGNAGDGIELSVMSFNIRYGTAKDGENHWDNRRGLVFDVLRKQDCDLVGLQEALRFQIDAICKAVPNYGEIGVGRDDGKTEGEYAAILYRSDRFDVTGSGNFWLSDTPEVVASTSWGNVIPRICTWGRFVHKSSGKAFYMFNAHLDHQSQPSREKSVVLITRRIAQREYPDPVVLTGDFNAEEFNPAILWIKGESNSDVKNAIPLVDTFRVLHPDATEVGTFNDFKGNRSGGKIDYVFTQPGIHVLDAKILFDMPGGRSPSDHFPVSARLKLAD